MPTLRRWLRHVVTALVALLLLFEEWGWEPLAALLARLARLPLLAWVERQIATLPPWAAVAVFALPIVVLLPVKLLALYFIGAGHAILGIGVLLGAKVVGTALVARLFVLTQPALMRLAWFARWYPRWKAWKDRMIAQVKASRTWRAAARAKAQAALFWADFRRRHRPGERP
jgi:hypothetical protein